MLLLPQRLQSKQKQIEKVIRKKELPYSIMVYGEDEADAAKIDAIITALLYHRKDYDYKHIVKELRDKCDMVTAYKTNKGIQTPERLIFVIDNIEADIIFKQDRLIEKVLNDVQADPVDFTTCEYLSEIECISNRLNYSFVILD